MAEIHDKPTTLIILGATGDLSQTRIYPAIYNLEAKGLLPANLKILGSARRELSNEEYGEFIATSVDENRDRDIDPGVMQKLQSRAKYFSGDFKDPASFNGIAESLDKLDEEHGACAHKIFYLAIAPNFFETVLEGISKSNLASMCKSRAEGRVVLEKPFGHDSESFRHLNGLTQQLFKEDQIYRIDHYLAKDTVQNLLYFKAHNPVFFDFWNNKAVKKIEVRAFEDIGVAGRGGYYNNFGHTRDMVQSHLLQVLALTMIDVRGRIEDYKVADLKAELINSLYFESEENIVRGQYTAGVVNGEEVIGYIEEEGIPEDSQTETFVKVDLKSSLKTWEGTEIKLVTGKRMSKKLTEVLVHLDSEGGEGENLIKFKIYPKQGMEFFVNVKNPSRDNSGTVALSFDYQEEFQSAISNAYEKVINDILKDRRMDFLTDKELEASWNIVDKIIASWEDGTPELRYYPAGSDKLIK